jgi:hypothetical protein
LLIRSIVRWTARGMAAIIAAIFLAFVVGEPSGPLSAIGAREWAGIMLQSTAVGAMLLAWKWELPAALISLLALAAFAAVVHMNRYDALIIAAIPDLLFLVDWNLMRLHKSTA